MTAALLAVTPGFDNPVSDSQRCFRAVLDATARPGGLYTLAKAPAVGQLSAAAAALCLTLADFETAVWLSPELRTAAVQHWLGFHCGCPLVERGDAAEFAIVSAGQVPPPLHQLRWGSEDYPDQSTSLWIGVDQLSHEPLTVDGVTALRLSGPGIQQTQPLFVAAAHLSASFWRALDDSRASFPRGVDLVLYSDSNVGRIAALPRTVRLGL